MKWMGACIQGDDLVWNYFRQHGNENRDHCIDFKLYYILLSTRNLSRYSPKERARKAKFKQQSAPHMTYANGARHRCAVCGRTELDDPCLEFQFCSKC